jgi:hypothetical protein
LAPVLREAEAELERRLREACEAEAEGIASESTGEIRRLEDALLKAAVAAKHTATLRDQVERKKAKPVEREVEMSPKRDSTELAQSADESRAERLSNVREFRDANGQLWRAWPVTPGLSREGRAERYLGEFHKGWICFEALGSSARRRLPQRPARWAELPDAELTNLLEQAIRAPERKERKGDAGKTTSQ